VALFLFEEGIKKSEGKQPAVELPDAKNINEVVVELQSKINGL
jgi:hypothetical protein